MNIYELAKRYQDAKNREAIVIAERRDLGKKLEAMIDGPLEGTAHAEDGEYKVTVTRKVNRVVDTEALKKEWYELPESARDAFKWTADLSLSAYRKLPENAMSKIDQFITMKPASPTIEVKEVKNGH